MPKIMRCDDVVPGCRTIIEGKDVVEVALKAREHTRTDHGLPNITAGLTILIQQAITEQDTGGDQKAATPGIPPATRGRHTRALLLSVPAADAGPLESLFRNEPEVLVARVPDDGRTPADFPAAEQAVIVTEWSRLARDPSLIDRWRRALAPARVAVLLMARRNQLDEALRFANGREVSDVLELPYHPGYVRHKIQAAFQYLGEQQGTRGLREELIEQAADFREFRRVAFALAAEADLNHLLELIVTKCREITCADAGSLYLVEKKLLKKPFSPDTLARAVRALLSAPVRQALPR